MSNISSQTPSIVLAGELPNSGKANLLGIWAETLIYGINMVLFPCCVYVLSVKRQQVNYFLISSSCLLFALSTAHMGISLKNLMDAFLKSTAPPLCSLGPTIYFINQDTLITSKNVVYSLNMYVQDALLLWRFHVVWGRNWKLSLSPIILFCATIITALCIIGRSVSSDIFTNQPFILQQLTIAAFSLGIVLNISLTSLIAWKLSFMDHYMGRTTGRAKTYSKTVWILVESGGIYTAMSIALLAVDSAAGGSMMQGLTNTATQVSTLSPLLIIFRLGMNIAPSTDSDLSKRRSFARLPRYKNSNQLASRPAERNEGSSSTDSYPLSTMDSSSYEAPLDVMKPQQVV